MDKLSNYNGSIDLISGLRPKNNGTFPLMQAHDVQVTETKRLDDMFSSPESWLPVYNGENEGGGSAEGGTSSGGSVSAGVPQYNLSTVLKAREEVLLDEYDSFALSSILSDTNNLLKFQNIGVVIQDEEGSGHQPFIGLDIKPDYVENIIILSYQGVFYNIDLIADLGKGTIKGRVANKPQVGGSDVLTIEISQTGASGLLDVDAVSSIVDRFPNVNIRVLGKYIYTPLEFDATTNTYKFANVNTSDTQAETKLITVNANTNQWTATQYLTDLGGGGNYVLELTGESGTLTDEQYQAVVDNFPNVVVKSGEYYYNGMQLTSTRYIFNVSGVVETAVGTVVTKQIQQSTIVVLRTSPQWVRVDTIVEIPSGGTTGSGLTKTKVTINELVSMLTAENAGTRVDFIPKSTFRGVLPSNESFLYMTGVFPTTGIIIQIAEDAFYIAGNGTAYTPALTSQFWDVSISVDSKARGIVTGATMNNGVLEANYQWNFADYVTDAYFDFYIYK